MVNLDLVLTTCCHRDVALHVSTDSIMEHDSSKQGITHHGLASFLYNRGTNLPEVFRCKDILQGVQFTQSKQNLKSLREKEFPLAIECFDQVLVDFSLPLESACIPDGCPLSTQDHLPRISALE
ncbi:hypothetical protein GJ744_002419 [Endocarpon pusillum]|uniref:Uncharacterized protein n=1 Tax=Endocarpon pusillum TaxID=364733 RepID=A0A8H7AAV6_9EURO|nr:hypothetical protein GJ744_002419 [Endocarpon pusillum]